MKDFVLINLVMLILYSCESGKVEDTSIMIYKMKYDYSKNVPVELSTDKSRITSAPGYINEIWPIKLTGGYYLNGSMGPNTGYTSLLINEYNKMEVKIGIDSLYKLIIDTDPFLEFYQRNDEDNTFHNDEGVNGIDTALLNKLIREEKLTLYFTRLK